MARDWYSNLQYTRITVDVCTLDGNVGDCARTVASKWYYTEGDCQPLLYTGEYTVGLLYPLIQAAVATAIASRPRKNAVTHASNRRTHRSCPWTRANYHSTMAPARTTWSSGTLTASTVDRLRESTVVLP